MIPLAQRFSLPPHDIHLVKQILSRGASDILEGTSRCVGETDSGYHEATVVGTGAKRAA